MPFLSLKNKLILVGILALFIGGSLYTAYWYHKGIAVCEADAATKQLLNEITVRKTYDKIDKETPFTADKLNALDWLYRKAGRN